MTLTGHDIQVKIPGTFRPFDPDKQLRIYTRNLPHWRQVGASYFVTFRLIDSIPYGIWQEMQAEAVAWKERAEREQHLHRGSLPEPLQREYEEFQHRHLSKVESILDSGVGACVLRDSKTREIMTEALHHFDGQRYHLHAFAVMPNHVHLAVAPRAGHELEDLLQSWKGFTGKQINTHLHRQGALWQAESYDRIIRDPDHFFKVVRYIALNARRAGLPAHSHSMWLGCGRLLDVGPENDRLREEVAIYGARDEESVW